MRMTLSIYGSYAGREDDDGEPYGKLSVDVDCIPLDGMWMTVHAPTSVIKWFDNGEELFRRQVVWDTQKTFSGKIRRVGLNLKRNTATLTGYLVVKWVPDELRRAMREPLTLAPQGDSNDKT